MEGGQGQDNGARLAWCESLFAEAAHVLTMAGVWVCGCVGVWVWVCGYVGVWVWVCGYVGVWVCGCVGASVRGCEGV